MTLQKKYKKWKNFQKGFFVQKRVVRLCLISIMRRELSRDQYCKIVYAITKYTNWLFIWWQNCYAGFYLCALWDLKYPILASFSFIIVFKLQKVSMKLLIIGLDPMSSVMGGVHSANCALTLTIFAILLSYFGLWPDLVNLFGNFRAKFWTSLLFWYWAIFLQF